MKTAEGVGEGTVVRKVDGHIGKAVVGMSVGPLSGSHNDTLPAEIDPLLLSDYLNLLSGSEQVC